VIPWETSIRTNSGQLGPEALFPVIRSGMRPAVAKRIAKIWVIADRKSMSLPSLGGEPARRRLDYRVGIPGDLVRRGDPIARL